MPADSLYEMTKRQLIRNIHMLEDIGDLPYAFLAPILRQMKNPDQLMALEANCPQILGETGEIWLKFIQRDIPDYQKQAHRPRDEKNWSKVYRKLKRDAEREEEAQKDALKQQMQALQQNRQGHQTTIIEGRTGQIPSATRKGFAFSGSSWSRSNAPKQTGKAAFDKLRRGIYDQKQARPKAAMMPAHILAERKKATAVQQAPARMVRQAELSSHNQGPQRMVLSKGASASVGAHNATAPITSRPNITSRSMPRPTTSTPQAAQRTRLPEGQQFSAPRLQSQRPTSSPAVKRRAEEPAKLFHESKRRRP
ncbi:hypothetical protein DM02DRAFT_146557 [Periconia macrospinosa]|uniref:Elongin-A n=1 Tax=Periconia macrospinosa TaxID=97972 RepID=A0A2V1DBW6_9PLEO|nr:hypothetical protein DM02DRAFT_146557 [Periconia macrospinosa]